jgi:hypothetical protein
VRVVEVGGTIECTVSKDDARHGQLVLRDLDERTVAIWKH